MWDGNLAGVAAWAPLAKLKLKAEKPLHAGSSDREIQNHSATSPANAIRALRRRQFCCRRTRDVGQ